MKNLKLFVWEDVCCDYTAGIMFALAESPAEARIELLKECDYIDSEDLAKEPEEWDMNVPRASVTWGGG